MLTMQLLIAVVASCLLVANAGNITGKIVYVSFGSDTVLKSINLASKNAVTTLLKFPPYSYPTWSQSSTSNQNNMFFYNFVGTDSFGVTVGVDVTTKKTLFSWNTDYFWRIGYDPSEPDSVFGLSIAENNILLEQINITSGQNKTLGMLPDGLITPANSAVYDDAAKVFYAYLYDPSYNPFVVGIDVTTGAVVSNGTWDAYSYYVCEAVRDESTGTFFGLVYDGKSDAWLATLDPITGKITAVGSTKMAISACDAGSALSSKQRLYFAYVKTADGNSRITVWNLDSGDLVEQFVVEEAVFGLQLFE
eukprot:TRINITY_DN1192_c0_g1_i1.p1 TRINITY_DN1192_c0_g1~~TRINITY_DN1192_c0_g1_i1.p1  ORF type:complete len:327 (+),score=98.17 TRINITY_DN1192_c0_g1_i1:66-983(+)